MSKLQALRHRTALCGVLAGALTGPALAQPSAPFATQTSNGTTPSYVVAGTTGTVGLTAPRTIIDWRDFNVANGETLTFNFQARADIVLNRIDFNRVQIDGALNSFVGSQPGGNVWISAPSGVIFGPTSQVNVGGLLATTATLTDTAAFLNPTTSRFAFAFTGTGFVSGTAYPAGSGYGGVNVQAGARLQTSGGLLALIAPFVSVASGASVGGGATGDVLVGGADAFTLALQQETAGDLDMLEFVIDTPTDVSTPIAIQGSLAGRNVYVATLAPSTLMNAVIVDTGPLAATRASNGAGGTIVLSSGADIITPDAQPTLSTGVTAGIEPLTIGSLTADTHAYIYSSGDLTAQAGSTLSGGAATIGVGGNATVATVDLTGPFAFAPIPGAVVPQFTATGPIAAGSVSVVRSGAIDVGNVTARTSDVTLQSLDSGGQGYDAVTAGTVVARGSVDMEGRDVTVASVTATTGGATLRAVTPRTPPVFVDVGSLSLATASVVEAQQGYASVGGVAFTDPSGAGTLAVSAPAGRVYVGYTPGGSGTGGGSGAITGTGRLTLTARDDVALDVQGSASVDTASSQLGSVALSADALSAGQVAAAVNASMVASTGDLSATQVQAGGPVILSAPAGAIQAGSLSGDSVVVTAAGSARVGDASTASTQDGHIRVTGSSVSITTAEPVSDLTATATAGPAAVGDVTAGGDVTIGAAGGAASLRSTTFTDTGLTYDPSATPGVLRMTATGAGGDVLLGPTGGFVTGATEIDLDAARDVTVQASGPIRLTSVSAGRNANLSAPTLTVDGVDALGDITASASGALVLTDVTPGASLTATGASLSLGVLRNPPPGDLTLVSTAAGFSRTAALSAGGTVTIVAAGPLSLTDVAAGTGGVTLTGSTVDAGAVSAGASSAITATGGGITLTSAQVSSATGGLTLVATGPIQATTLRAGGDIDATAGGGLSLSEATSRSGAVTLVGSTVDGETISAATQGSVTATAGGITVNSAQVASSTGSLTLVAQGPIQATTLTAGGDIGATAVDLLSASEVTSGNGAVTLTGSMVVTGTISAATQGSITATEGGITLTSAEVSSSTGGLTLAAPGPIQATTLRAGGDIGATAGAGISLSEATSQSGAVTLVGSTVDAETISAATQGSVTATAGEITLTSAEVSSATGGLTLAAPGPIQATTLRAGGDIGAAAGGGVSASEATSRSGAVTLVGSTVDAETISAATQGSVTATAGGITVNSAQVASPTGSLTLVAPGPIQATTLRADGDIGATAGGGLSLSEATSRSGAVSLVGSTVDAETISAATQGSVTATAGGITLTSAQISSSVGGLTLTASGPIQATTLTTGGALAAAAGGGLSLSDATSRSGAVTLVGSTVDAETISAATESSVTATAGAITLNSAQVSSSTGGLTLAAPGPIQATTLRAGGDIGATAGGGLSLSEATSRSGAVTLVGSTVDAETLSAATGSITATGGGITLASAQVASPTGNLTLFAKGPIQATTLTAGGAITASTTNGATPGGAGIDVGSLVAQSAALSAGDGYVSVTNGAVSPRGLLDVRASGPGGSVYLGYAPGGSGAGGGTGSLMGETALRADADISVDVQGAAAIRSAIAGGDATVLADAVTLGSASADTLALTGRTGDVSAGAATARADFAANAPGGSVSVASLTDGGATLVAAGQDVSLGIVATGGAGGVTAGRDLAVTGASAVNLAGAALSAGRDATLSSAGLFSLGSLSAARAARIVAGDLAVNGALTSPTAAIEAATGAMSVGDGAAGGGLALSAAEFGRIRASRSLSLYAGSTTGTLRGDLTVGDLAVDPAAIPNLELYAAAGHIVSVTGALAPTATGGAVAIGGSLTSGWRPTSVLVSGSLGAATFVSETQFTGVRAFDRIALNATGDILIGSSRFIAAVQGTPALAIDVAANRPGGLIATGAEVGRVSLIAGSLAIATDGKVVQQNTSGSPFTYSGTYLIGSPGSPGVVLTIDPPSVLDLFGSYVGADGRTATGRLAARGAALSVVARAPGAEYRFNGCEIGSLGACGVSEVIGPEQGLRLLDAQQAAVLAAVTTRQQELTESALLDDDPQAQTQDELDPVVTGAGNEEIWRTRRKASQ